jgi:hypothetical protein
VRFSIVFGEADPPWAKVERVVGNALPNHIRLRRGIWIFENLFADQNQNARCKRENSHYDRRDRNMKERGDSDENQVNREQEHSNVFSDHGVLLREGPRFCTLLICALLKLPKSECRNTRLRLNASLARRSLGEGGNALTNQPGGAICDLICRRSCK